jgi:hypothetical protein
MHPSFNPYLRLYYAVTVLTAFQQTYDSQFQSVSSALLRCNTRRCRPRRSTSFNPYLRLYYAVTAESRCVRCEREQFQSVSSALLRCNFVSLDDSHAGVVFQSVSSALLRCNPIVYIFGEPGSGFQSVSSALLRCNTRVCIAICQPSSFNPYLRLYYAVTGGRNWPRVAFDRVPAVSSEGISSTPAIHFLYNGR